ncbi:MAG: hypothetical protein IJ302_03335 [Clostridia bacterium]|nr:hypothetical protein [Clostridia bacterium]
MDETIDKYAEERKKWKTICLYFNQHNHIYGVPYTLDSVWNVSYSHDPVCVLKDPYTDEELEQLIAEVLSHCHTGKKYDRYSPGALAEYFKVRSDKSIVRNFGKLMIYWNKDEGYTVIPTWQNRQYPGFFTEVKDKEVLVPLQYENHALASAVKDTMAISPIGPQKSAPFESEMPANRRISIYFSKRGDIYGIPTGYYPKCKALVEILPVLELKNPYTDKELDDFIHDVFGFCFTSKPSLGKTSPLTIHLNAKSLPAAIKNLGCVYVFWENLKGSNRYTIIPTWQNRKYHYFSYISTQIVYVKESYENDELAQGLRDAMCHSPIGPKKNWSVE